VRGCVLIYWPADRTFEKDIRGFRSPEEAERYFGEHVICSRCREELRNGGYFSENRDGTRTWVPRENAFSTACGAEWGLMDLEEYLEGHDGSRLKRFDEQEGP
jgi:hypothetical protein